MSTRRFIALTIAALIVIAGAMYLSNQRYLERDPRGGAFMANLNSRLDAVSQLRIRKDAADPTVTLDRVKPGQWSIAQRDGYPADAGKVRRLLLALSDAKIVEEKTSSPANYAAIGVADPSPVKPAAAPGSSATPDSTEAPGSSTTPDSATTAGPAAEGGGTEVTLVAPNAVSSVIVGRSSGNGTFARRGGEAKSYVIEPAVSVESAPRDWIETKLLDIPVEKIRAVDIRLADGSAYSISRKSAKQARDPKDKSTDEPKDSDFALDKVPAGREAAEPSSIGPSPTTYGGVTADDVSKAAAIDFAKPSIARISLFDGGSYTITGTVAGDKHWILIEAPVTDAALSAKAKDHAFEIASYRYDAIFRPLEQVLKPKPADSKTKSAKTSKPATT